MGPVERLESPAVGVCNGVLQRCSSQGENTQSLQYTSQSLALAGEEPKLGRDQRSSIAGLSQDLEKRAMISKDGGGGENHWTSQVRRTD